MDGQWISMSSRNSLLLCRSLSLLGGSSAGEECGGG